MAETMDSATDFPWAASKAAAKDVLTVERRVGMKGESMAAMKVAWTVATKAVDWEQ